MPDTIARPTVIPYVVSWDSELASPLDELTWELVPKPRLAYKGRPRAADRDGAGVLWGRVSSSPGVGRPHFDSMHPGRQWECMYALKCQVCGQPANRNEDGWLFLDWRRPDSPPTWPEGSPTTMPPVCEEHARLSVQQCPHLTRTDFVALRVKLPRLWGVVGTHYHWTGDGWIEDATIPALKYGDERLNAVLGSLLVRQLLKVTVVELP